MKARLIVHNLSELTHYQKVLLNREIYGYADNSNNNTYHYKREGILAKMPNFRLLKGAYIIRKEDLIKIKPIYKRYNVKYDIYEIIIDPSKFKKV